MASPNAASAIGLLSYYYPDFSNDELRERIENNEIRELIVATNPTVKGEATALFLKHEFSEKIQIITRLACGIPAGGDLEYVDDVTMTEAFFGRNKFFT